MDRKKYVVDRGKIFWRQVAEDTVVLDVDSGFYYVLDELGSSIWKMAIGRKSLDWMVSKITQEYKVDRATCQKDVETFLKSLECDGLIKKS